VPLKTHSDDASHVLTIRRDGEIGGPGRPRDGRRPGGDRAVLRQPTCRRDQGTAENSHQSGPQLFPTSPERWLSIIIWRALRAIETWSASRCIRCVSAPTSMSRAAGWHEVDLVDQRSRSRSRVRIVKRITRCCPVNVDPDTGARDLAIPQALMRRFATRMRDLCRGNRRRQQLPSAMRSRRSSRSCCDFTRRVGGRHCERASSVIASEATKQSTLALLRHGLLREPVIGREFRDPLARNDVEDRGSIFKQQMRVRLLAQV